MLQISWLCFAPILQLIGMLGENTHEHHARHSDQRPQAIYLSFLIPHRVVAKFASFFRK